MQPTHRIHASWLEDADTTENFWSPLPNAEQFYVISCYVGLDGWRRLAEHLQAGIARDPPMKALLIFSRKGLESSGGVDLIDTMKAFIDLPVISVHVDIFIIDDSRKELFHPKAHGSRRGLYHRVVVGSANMTRGGMLSHHEMGTVTENDHGVWAAFERALWDLRDLARDLKDPENYEILRSRPSESAQAPSTNIPPRAPAHGDATLAGVLGGRLDLLTPHFPVHLGHAMELVGQFFRGGRKLSRTSRSLEYSTKIQLGELQDAGILEPSGKRQLSRNVSLDGGSGDFTVQLFSPGLVKQVSRFKQRVGILYGATTIDIAGVVWIPTGWVDALRAKWRQLLAKLRISELRGMIEAFTPELMRQFEPNTPGFRALEQDLTIMHPAKWWHHKLARKLLRLRDDDVMPTEVSPEIRRQVAGIASVALKDALEARLLDIHWEEDFAHLSELPCPAEVFTPSVGDAVDILAEITLLAIAGKTDHGEGANKVLAKRFAEMLTTGHNAQEIAQEARRWKQRLAGEPLPHLEEYAALFAHAWRYFDLWFDRQVLAPGHYVQLPRQLQVELTNA